MKKITLLLACMMAAVCLFAESNKIAVNAKNAAAAKNAVAKNMATKNKAVTVNLKVTAKNAEALQNQGNYRDAFNVYHKLLLDKKYMATAVDNAKLLNNAVFCLKRLRLEKDFDGFITQIVKRYSDDWRVIEVAANSYINVGHYGFRIAGEFERGSHRGGGEAVIAAERDRCHSLQLYIKAMQLMQQNNKATTAEKRNFFVRFSQALSYNRSGSQSWRLQYLTDLTELPDYRTGYRWSGYSRGGRGAPVDADGNPIFYSLPKTFANAANDGERWRWALNESKQFGNVSADYSWAKFLLQQFGVQTMARWLKPDEQKDGPFAVHLLSDNETIARLASGCQRFKLPPQSDYIAIFKKFGAGTSSVSKQSLQLNTQLRRTISIANTGSNSVAEQSLNQLAGIFSNRRQYVKAAGFWRESIKRFGDGRNRWKQRKLEQIVGNWGTFQSVNKFAAGRQPEVMLRYRNADQVSFELYQLKREVYLADVKRYLESNPVKLDWERMRLNRIGYMVVNKNENRYIDKRVQQWNMKLTPLANHFDRLAKVTMPVDKAGIYLLKAQMADGNTSRIIVWITNAAIVSRVTGKNKLFYVADAASGAPVADSTIDFFGYRTKYLRGKWLGGRRYDIQIDKFSVKTDKAGMVVVPNNKFSKGFNYLKIVNGNGRFAATEFESYWYPQSYRSNYDLRKIFGISDRPVYRPGQDVNFKYWIRQVAYAIKDDRSYGNIPVTVEIWSPRGQKIWAKSITTNKFGGLDGSYELPADATLGNYNIRIKNWGGYFNFRVEEYKKPEYEVTVDAPKDPVTLGDKFTATIRAKYYFGAPVTKAKVKYKVLRYEHNFSWFPYEYWDWLYGSGYWWFSCDYSWYPGWERWGWKCPVMRWLPWYRPVVQQPEVVAENEVDISSDGTVKVVIDSASAKAMFGDRDSRYEITAEVVDSSRRTIVGKGQVIAAVHPFRICSWTNMGFYRVDNDIEVGLKAISPDNKGVAGEGRLTLFLISYDRDGKPAERALRQWKLDTDAEGNAKLKFSVATAGQYRIEYELKDAKGGFAIGGNIFSVLADSGKPNDNFRFTALELVNDKKSYVPGDELELLINTDRPGSTVMLFVRAGDDKKVLPEIIKLNGRTMLKKVKITKADMPNFFIEAWTVADGKIHKVVKRIAVPPEKRVLNVEVIPSKERYKPGEKAKVKLKITDYYGKPVQGEVVVTIYDKAVEYISGGSNVTAIQPFFWKWLKRYYLRLGFSMNGSFYDILKRGELPLQNVGVFGRLSSPEIKSKSDGIAGGGGARLKKSRMMEMKSAPAMMAMDSSEATFGSPTSDDSTPAAPEVKVRTQFADTAFWAASLVTNHKGMVEVALDMPENLTTWKIKAWSMAAGTKVGQGETEVITTKDFLIRMQLPRFLVENDQAVISAIVHNYLPEARVAEVKLKLGGDALSGENLKTVKVEIASQGEKRIDWQVKAVREGKATITMSAITKGDGDAMEMSLPVLVHGVAKQLSYSGALRGAKKVDRAFITIDLPEQRRIESARLQINYSPTLAAAMLDALPYLISCDYRNTEATLNRFLPAVIVQQTLKRTGVNLQQIKDKITNLNPQELGKADKRAKQWQQRWQGNPVFDDQKLKQLVAEGIKALRFMQNSDGGWGWFSGYNEHSWIDTTAQVVRGLLIARDNGVAVDSKSLQRGIEWLKVAQRKRLIDIRDRKYSIDNSDALILRVLSLANVNDDNMAAMSGYLYQQRHNLSLYGKALLALALERRGEKAQMAMLKRNIEQFLMQDDENQTAWLRMPASNRWWFWYGSEYETQAAYLELLNRTAPGSDVASRLVKYLLNNRKHATYWNSTRDTAYCLEALAGYLVASNELNPDMTVKLIIDGKLTKSVKITKANLFTFDSSLVMYGKELTTGKHTIELQREGEGTLYFNAYLAYFSLEKFIKKAGLEIKVERRYYRLERDRQATVKTAGARGQAIDMKVQKYRRVALTTGDKVESGDLIEVELIIASKNDYSYMMFEDRKFAGGEPVDLRSGYNGNALGAYVEFRDANVRFFVRRLMRGKHSVSYRIRAEIPGVFSALPASGLGIYAPELKANSDEFKVKIEDL
ncbi:MAG: MG2 domain-containing protein [Victivallaceae bacterium]|nr:MG2 domain-containing protein [Victivallaceae bacterium]